MLKITNKLLQLSNISDLQEHSYLSDNFSQNINDYIFFDIETTGFSYKNSMCYLIGAIYYNRGFWMYTQWFAVNPSDESEILNDFVEFSNRYRYIVSFNGERFDIPFINGRCELLESDVQLENINNRSIDIFHIIQPLKNLLNLDNYKQKSIEEFLGIHRIDKYNGGELIKCYKQYIISKDESLLNTLLLHNHDDIIGLANITPVLNYMDIINHNISYTASHQSDYAGYNGDPSSEFIFTFNIPHAVNVPVNIIKEPFFINIANNIITVKVNIINDKLKYFYSNYKDYYYIPSEDQAMHKSVSSYIDKKYRQPAKASNCYVHKAGQFLMQYSNIITPFFKRKYNDNFSYFELNDSFINSPDKITDYVKDILFNIL